jgi:hypothetical protein
MDTNKWSDSRPLVSIRGSGIRSVPSQPLSGFALSVPLSLNFGHFREDSFRASEALPRRLRRYAHTPTRRYDLLDLVVSRSPRRKSF